MKNQRPKTTHKDKKGEWMAKKILIVDDEKNIQDLIKRILSRNKYKITTASTGEEALNKIYSEFKCILFILLNNFRRELNAKE